MQGNLLMNLKINLKRGQGIYLEKNIYEAIQ